MNQLLLASRRRKRESLAKAFPDAAFVDVTSKGEEPWVKLSPFYPHGGIPVPYSPGVDAMSVEGIWQGLKVFENADIDPSKFNITQMKGIKRTTRRFGRILGHRQGMDSSGPLLDYETARKTIYLPSYLWVLRRSERELEALKKLLATSDVVLLDYETNPDISNLKTPLSHAALVQAYVLEGDDAFAAKCMTSSHLR